MEDFYQSDYNFSFENPLLNRKPKRIMGDYAHCLSDPFDPDSEGAQVPDPWCYPTATSSCTYTFTINCDSNGNFAFVVQPDLIQTIMIQNPTVNTASTAGGYDNLSYQPGGSGASSYIMMGAVEESALQDQFENYRIVGWGVNVKTTQPVLNQQGTVYVASVPVTANRPWGKQFGCTVTDWLNFQNYPGVDSTGYVTTGIQQLVTGQCLDYQEIALADGLEFVSKHCSGQVFDFRAAYNDVTLLTSDSNNYTYQQGIPVWGWDQDTETITTGQMAAIQAPEYIDIRGWTAWMVSGRAVSSGTVTNVCTVTVKFHVEGTLPLSTGKGISGFNTGAKMPPVAPHLIQRAQTFAASLPSVRKIKHKAKRGWRQFERGFNKFAKGVQGSIQDSVIAAALL